MTTAFIIAKFEFSQAQREELTLRGLPEGAVDDLQAELEIVKSFEATQPASRREMLSRLSPSQRRSEPPIGPSMQLILGQ
jgi:hypothetical protein